MKGERISWHEPEEGQVRSGNARSASGPGQHNRPALTPLKGLHTVCALPTHVHVSDAHVQGRHQPLTHHRVSHKLVEPRGHLLQGHTAVVTNQVRARRFQSGDAEPRRPFPHSASLSSRLRSLRVHTEKPGWYGQVRHKRRARRYTKSSRSVHRSICQGISSLFVFVSLAPVSCLDLIFVHHFFPPSSNRR